MVRPQYPLTPAVVFFSPLSALALASPEPPPIWFHNAVAASLSLCSIIRTASARWLPVSLPSRCISRAIRMSSLTMLAVANRRFGP